MLHGFHCLASRTGEPVPVVRLIAHYDGVQAQDDKPYSSRGDYWLLWKFPAQVPHAPRLAARAEVCARVNAL